MNKTFTNFRAAVDSFPLGEKYVGLLKPGRYSGFDTLTTRGALDISIGHSGKLKKTGTDNNYAPNYGALMFSTGTIYHSDEVVQLQVQGNSGNPSPRIDFVIAENSYQEIQGGTPVIFSIIQGAMGGTEPVLSNPAKQVHVGTIKIVANGYLYTDITYTPKVAPLLGDVTYNEFSTMINQYVNIPVADETKRGIARTGTQVEVNDGIEALAYVTPKTLHSKKATQTKEGIVRMATDTEILEGSATNLPVSAKQFRGKDRKVDLTADYILKPEDIGVVFINKGAGLIEISVPPSLGENVFFGFLAMNGNIKLKTVSGNVSISAQANKLLQTNGLNTGMLLESVGTDAYILIGNLKNS